jgi:large repetitive protein
VYDGKTKVLITTSLIGKNNGTKSFKLPRLAKGKHKIHVVYLGATTIAGSKTAAQVLTVTK